MAPPRRPNAAHPRPRPDDSDDDDDDGKMLNLFSLSERVMKYPLLGTVLPRKVKTTGAVGGRRHHNQSYNPVTVKNKWISIDGSQIPPPPEIMSFGKRHSSKFHQLSGLTPATSVLLSPVISKLSAAPSLSGQLRIPSISQRLCTPLCNFSSTSDQLQRSAKRQIPAIKILQL